MLWKLALAMTIIPAVELFLLIYIGTWIGPLYTTLIIVFTGLLGAWLAKREGLGVLRSIRDDLQKGMPPTGRLAEGALVLAGGLFLLTPGIMTDLTGFFFILPPTRRLLAPVLARWVAKKLGVNDGGKTSWNVQFGGGNPPGPVPPGDRKSPFDHPVA